jgi:hypothetical protein
MLAIVVKRYLRVWRGLEMRGYFDQREAICLRLGGNLRFFGLIDLGEVIGEEIVKIQFVFGLDVFLRGP